MGWPLAQDYNEAVQNPRSSFNDAELREGQAATNALGIPMPRSGNFADVYELRCPSGAHWAVKCFTREVHGLHDRYAEISTHLHQAKLPFTVDFHYLDEGIRIRGYSYPVLKMQWVEGFTLNEFVRDNLDKPAALEALLQIWVRMAKRLREAKMAHADLQHGNVLMVPGSRAESLAVKLIDYDGMWVPSLAGKKSGEVGHPAFQHPQRLREGTYSAEVDRFPLLTVATALRGLKVGGKALWDRYDNGDNLLFREEDFKTPEQSPLFQELRQLSDSGVQSLVEPLLRACKEATNRVPLLDEVLEGRTTSSPVAETTRKSTSQQPLVAATAPVVSLTRKSNSIRSSEVAESWDTVVEAEERPPRRHHARQASTRRNKSMMPWVGIAVGAATMLAVVVLGAVGFLVLRGVAPVNQQANQGSTPIPSPTDQPHVIANKGDPEVKPGNAPSPLPTRDKVIDKSPNAPPNNQDTPGNQHDPRLTRFDGIQVGEILRFEGFRQAIGQLTLSSDGRWLLCDSSQTSVYELDLEKHDIRLACSVGVRETPRTSVFSPGGKAFYMATKDGYLRQLSVPSGKELRHFEIEKSANGYVHLFCSSDGKRLLPFDQGVPLYFCDEATGKKEPIGAGGHMMVATLAPDDDQLLFSRFDDIACLWSTKEKKELHRFRGHKGRVQCMTFSTDSMHAVTGDQGGFIRLWDVRDGRELRAFRGDNKTVWRLALSPDGRRALSADRNRDIILWNMQNGKELYRLEGICAIFTHDGSHAVTGDILGRIRVWRLPPEPVALDKPLK